MPNSKPPRSLLADPFDASWRPFGNSGVRGLDFVASPIPLCSKRAPCFPEPLVSFAAAR